MDEQSRFSETLCGVRPGEPCRLCVPGATGPQDCGLVYLVMTDLVLRTELARMEADDRSGHDRGDVPCSLRAKTGFPRNT